MTTSTKVVTGPVRLSYVHVFEPFAFQDEEPKYSVMLLVDKKDKATIDKLRAAEALAIEQGISTKFGGKKPAKLASIIKDADEDGTAEEYPERAGCLYMTVRTDRKPGVVDADVNPILNQSEVYSGCYARVSVTAFPYKFGNTAGVSFGLNNIQKVADGEPLGGIARAEDEFDAYEADDLI